MTLPKRISVLARRFAASASGGAGHGYLLFTACWAAAVFYGAHATTSASAAKLNAVAKALGGSFGSFR